MNVDNGNSDFDQLLERELHQRVGGLQGPNPQVEQSAYHAAAITGGTTMSISSLSSLTSLVSAKAAVGITVAVLAIGGGSVAATVATGSPNPVVWGQTVTAAVASCKAGLATGQHGIGDCVSAVAKQKGQQERNAHSAASSARENHPTGEPSGLPTGQPSGLP